MMSKKAELFGDMEIRDRIMATGHQAEIKKLGRKVRNFDEQVWGMACRRMTRIHRIPPSGAEVICLDLHL